MPKKTKPSAPPGPSAAQRERAASLRAAIRDVSSGDPPAGAPPPTPREVTDGAAQRAWERQRKKGKT